MARFLTRLIDAQAPWARPLGDFIHGIVHWLFHRMKRVHNVLNGTWLGHPLHGVLTDVPVGVFTVVILLDVLQYPQAADVALGFGVLAMLGAAVAAVQKAAADLHMPSSVATAFQGNAQAFQT